MSNDVKMTYFYTPVRSNIYVEILEEDRDAEDNEQDLVGRLRLSMYGTREAAAAWQDKICKVMLNNDFQQSVINPCLYMHRQRQINAMVHGDNFVSVADERDLQWLNKTYPKKRSLISKPR